MTPVNALLVVGGVVVFLLLAVRPLVGVCALIAFYPLVPVLPRTPVPGLNAETILVSFAMILTLARSGLKIPPLRISGSVIAFILVAIMGWLVANTWMSAPPDAFSPWERFKVLKMRVFQTLLFFVAYWWLARPADRRRLLESVSLGILVVGFAVIVDGILSAGTGKRAAGLHGDSNSAANILAAFLVVPLYLLRRADMVRLRRAVHLAAYGLGLVALALTLSRGAWLAILVGHAVWFLYVNRQMLAVGAAAMLLAVTIAAPLVPDLIRERVVGTFETKQVIYQVGFGIEIGGSAGFRLAAYRVGFDMFKDEPIWGHGSEAFKALSTKYGAKYGLLKYKGPHSLTLKIGSETGLIGLASLGWLIAAVLFLGRRLWRLPDPEHDLGALLLAVGAGIGAGNLTSTDFLISPVSAAYFWALLGMCARFYFAPAEAVAPVPHRRLGA